MLKTGSSGSSGQNFAPAADTFSNSADVLIINFLNLILAEPTYLRKRPLPLPFLPFFLPSQHR